MAQGPIILYCITECLHLDTANTNTELISIFIRIPLYNRRFIDRTFTKFFQSETFTLDIDSVEAPLRDGFIMNVGL